MTTALILAGLAAAYLAWARPAASGGLPLPVPAVAGPAPVAAPAARSGPHPLTLVAILVAGGMIAFAIRESRTPAPGPAPAPAPVTGLDLRGLFRGPEAASDAAVTAALLAELADVIEWDGKQTEPRLRTGAAFDDLRRSSRELRTRGVSVGARQPAVRDAIRAYLDQAVGTDGGPVDAAQRAKWVSAFREVAAAAEAAAR